MTSSATALVASLDLMDRPRVEHLVQAISNCWL
jgi:hypothetical protein